MLKHSSHLFQILRILLLALLLPTLAAADFSDSHFNFGRAWDGDGADYSGVDYISIWAGSDSPEYGVEFNPWWQGLMLDKAKQIGATPVYYAYLIAFKARYEQGLQDCDVASTNTLCTNGAQFIRDNRAAIITHYSNYAQATAQRLGNANTEMIWMIEPDFMQYSATGDALSPYSQVGGGIPDAQMATLMSDIISAIKSRLPNAKIAMDISPWNNNIEAWLANFQSLPIDYMFTSGGRTEAETARIRSDNNNLVTWNQVSSYTGRKIIADAGYGVGGGSTGHDSDWDNVTNLNNRIADGVLAITQNAPKAGWASTIASIRPQLNSIPGATSSSSVSSSSMSSSSVSSSSVSSSSVSSSSVSSSSAPAAPAGSPVANWGALSVNGTKIVDKNGQAVQLRGMSLFWSQWMGQYFNSSVVNWLGDDWNASLVRAAMGIELGGYLSNPSSEEQKVRAVVDAAIAKGMYVIIDWHDHNAQNNQAAAVEFFSRMAQDYGHYPNVIYEIYNEPDDESWSTVKAYSETVIAAIRAKDPDNLIIIGSPRWSQDVDVASYNPIAGTNLAYTLHFYAATHKQELRSKAQTAMNNGLAIFVTEWGTSEANGDGYFDQASSDTWLNWLDANDISWANWSIADKAEISAALKPGASATGGWPTSQLTESGNYLRNRLRSYPSVFSSSSSSSSVSSSSVSSSSVSSSSVSSSSVSSSSVSSSSVSSSSVSSSSVSSSSATFTGSYQDYYGAPSNSALPSVNSSFTYIEVFGTGGPDMSAVTNFTINWDLPNQGLYQMSINTSNGVPSWWKDMRSSATHSFAQSQPEIVFAGSGLAGLDGEYYITGNAEELVLVDKADNFVIVFATSEISEPSGGSSSSSVSSSSVSSSSVSSSSVSSSSVSSSSVSSSSVSSSSVSSSSVSSSSVSSSSVSSSSVSSSSVSSSSVSSSSVSSSSVSSSSVSSSSVSSSSTGGLLVQYGVPLSEALPSAHEEYLYIQVDGSGGPDLSNVTNWVINWDLYNNGLYQFSINTSNGSPNWYVDLRASADWSFNGGQPEITFAGTGVEGLDGEYWVTKENSRFVLVEKSGSYAIVLATEASALPRHVVAASEWTIDYSSDLRNQQDLKMFYPEAADVSFELRTLTGQLLYSDSFQGNEGYALNLSAAGLDYSGVYYLILNAQGHAPVVRQIVLR